MRKTDFIIVGQGIAGSTLALELISEGKSVVVIDNPGLSNCSKVAAGIYNPVVFKRLTQSWMADMVLPVMLDFFSELETKFQTQLVHRVKIARVFSGKEEEVLWQKKSANELSDFIDGTINVSSSVVENRENAYSFLKNPHAFVKQGGYVNVPAYLEHTRNFLEQRNAFVNERFDYKLLQFEGENSIYNNISCTKIIFCEGHLIGKNPWFADLKFKPAKGEVLTIYCEEMEFNTVLNKEIFILPLPAAHHFKVGATYNWEDLTDEVTDQGKSILEEKLKKLIPFKYKILKHEAGVRPSTSDRRPVMGFHSENFHYA